MNTPVEPTWRSDLPLPDGSGAEAGEFSPGQRVGRYVIRDLLGRGGMGVVYLADQLEPVRRTVALKLIRPERLGSVPARERFWREAKLAARLEHPHICAVYEVGEAQGMPFMAMRFVAGETLAARIAREATTTRGTDLERRRIDERDAASNAAKSPP